MRSEVALTVDYSNSPDSHAYLIHPNAPIDRRILSRETQKDGLNTVLGLHAKISSTTRLCTVFTAVVVTLTLISCTTLPQPPISTVEPTPPRVIDAPVGNDIPIGVTVNQQPAAQTTTQTRQTPVQPAPTVQAQSSNEKAPEAKTPTSRATPKTESTQRSSNTPAQQATTSKQPAIRLPDPVIVDRISRTGNLQNTQLAEVSGMAASRNSPGVLYAVNDSGDSATLYALSERGKHIAQWSIDAKNRDWEELDNLTINNRNYLLIGDTGDNGRARSKSTFYLIAEPLPNVSPKVSLTPAMTIDFVYDDGPRNVEAFAVHGETIYLVSKEPLSSNGATASRLYALNIPLSQPANPLTAVFIGELPIPRPSLESKLAASFVGVDLDHITAMDITASGRTAYLLTYREVHKVERQSDESWSKALQRRGKRIFTHKLGQAEALAIAAGRSVFITSENRGAALWSIPIQAAP